MPVTIISDRLIPMKYMRSQCFKWGYWLPAYTDIQEDRGKDGMSRNRLDGLHHEIKKKKKKKKNYECVAW
jgi:hypothetical protein